MEEAAQLRSLMFVLTYLLMKRRRDLSNATTQRRLEIRRRVQQRVHFLQRQRRMLMMMIARGMRPNVQVRTRAWSNTTSTDWWERVVMMEFGPSDWLDKFRMSRETFFFLCEALRPRLARQDTSFRPALPLEKRVAVALWRLASNIEYRTISTLFGVGKSTVCRCVRDMCHAIVALLRPVYLCSPTPPELHESAQMFLSHWGFPHCVAAVATIHISILTPSTNVSDYANPAGWLSVMSQVAVSGSGRFWDVCASFPGGTDPSEILQNSTLWATASEGGLSPDPSPNFMGQPLRYVLLGEVAYPLQSWLMKPYPEDEGTEPSAAEPNGAEPNRGGLTASQWGFNLRFARARGVVEEAVMRLRGRWQCLSKRNDCGLDVIPTMILACCVLHNLCEAHGDTFQQDWHDQVLQAQSPQPRPQQAPFPSADLPQAEAIRQLYCDYFLQND